MKKQILTLCAVTGLMVAGCVTSPTTGKTIPDIPRIAAFTFEAASIGTSEAIARKPELKESFILVAAQLAVLEAQPDLTVESLLAVLRQLPVDKLQGKNATLAFSVARLALVSTGWSTVEIVRAEQLRPVVTALREGLIAGGAVQ